MESEKGYWQRQAYLLSSLGLFYIILIALFAIPLVGTCVVILIKGALDLRYIIIAGGCVGLAVFSVLVVRALRRLGDRIRQDGRVAGEDVRRSLLIGKPVEISIFNGLLKFNYGHVPPDERPAITHHTAALLPQHTDRRAVAEVVDQLQNLSELRRVGTIDDDEFDLLKSMLIESSAASCAASERDRS